MRPRLTSECEKLTHDAGLRKWFHPSCEKEKVDLEGQPHIDRKGMRENWWLCSECDRLWEENIRIPYRPYDASKLTPKLHCEERSDSENDNSV